MERAADLDLWLRMLELGTGYVSADVTVRYHLHEGQISGDLIKMCDAHEAVVEAYRDRSWLSRSVGAQSETRLLWDRLRHDLRMGDRRAGARAAVADRARPVEGARAPAAARLPPADAAAALALHAVGWADDPAVDRLAGARRGDGQARSGGRRAAGAARPARGPAERPAEPAGLTITDSGLRAAIARAAGSSVVRPSPTGAGLPAS